MGDVKDQMQSSKKTADDESLFGKLRRKYSRKKDDDDQEETFSDNIESVYDQLNEFIRMKKIDLDNEGSDKFDENTKKLALLNLMQFHIEQTCLCIEDYNNVT